MHNRSKWFEKAFSGIRACLPAVLLALVGCGGSTSSGEHTPCAVANGVLSCPGYEVWTQNGQGGSQEPVMSGHLAVVFATAEDGGPPQVFFVYPDDPATLALTDDSTRQAIVDRFVVSAGVATSSTVGKSAHAFLQGGSISTKIGVSIDETCEPTACPATALYAFANTLGRRATVVVSGPQPTLVGSLAAAPLSGTLDYAAKLLQIVDTLGNYIAQNIGISQADLSRNTITLGWPVDGEVVTLIGGTSRLALLPGSTVALADLQSASAISPQLFAFAQISDAIDWVLPGIFDVLGVIPVVGGVAGCGGSVLEDVVASLVTSLGPNLLPVVLAGTPQSWNQGKDAQTFANLTSTALINAALQGGTKVVANCAGAIAKSLLILPAWGQLAGDVLKVGVATLQTAQSASFDKVQLPLGGACLSSAVSTGSGSTTDQCNPAEPGTADAGTKDAAEPRTRDAGYGALDGGQCSSPMVWNPNEAKCVSIYVGTNAFCTQVCTGGTCSGSQCTSAPVIFSLDQAGNVELPTATSIGNLATQTTTTSHAGDSFEIDVSSQVAMLGYNTSETYTDRKSTRLNSSH